tara:strand:- start:348 stop:755 length:408 start_codon:yes stop_codon:yes gene_type:complete
MLQKILSLAKKRFKQISSKRQNGDSDLLDNPVAQFTIQIDTEGEFAIHSECYSLEDDHAGYLGQLLFLINNGMLSDYFVESLRLEADGDEDKMAYCMLAMQSWKLFYEEYIEQAVDSTKDAVDPKDVFSFYKMRP